MSPARKTSSPTRLQRDVIRPSLLIEVRRSELHGSGVFATAPIADGQIIEVCPGLLFDEHQWETIDGAGLHGYCYDTPDGQAILALGFGSLYNHAENPTAEYRVELSPPRVTLRAAGAIDPGQEITISYGPVEDLWFEMSLPM
jgi:uncharacterized protein